MKRFLLFVTAIIVLASCTQTPPTTPQTREDVLRIGKWVRVSCTKHIHTWDGSDTTKDVYTSYLPACLKDDTLVFSTSHLGTRYYGASRCSGGDPDHVTFNWGLSNNGNNIYIYGNVKDFFFPIDPMPFHNVDEIIIDSASVNGTLPNFYDGAMLLSYKIYAHDATYPYYTDTVTYQSEFDRY